MITRYLLDIESDKRYHVNEIKEFIDDMLMFSKNKGLINDIDNCILGKYDIRIDVGKNK